MIDPDFTKRELLMVARQIHLVCWVFACLLYKGYGLMGACLCFLQVAEANRF